MIWVAIRIGWSKKTDEFRAVKELSRVETCHAYAEMGREFW